MAREGGSSTAFRELLSLAEQFGSTDLDVKSLLQDPDQVVDSIERFGTHKLGEFEIEEKYAVCAFKGAPMLTMGMEESRPVDWQRKWTHVLETSWVRSSKRERTQAAGFNQRVKLEAHVVNLLHAAGPPGVGLLQPILVRWQSKAAPLSVFALPAVQTILFYKWAKWAKKVLLVEFAVYLLWLLSTVIFAFAFVDEDLTLGLKEIWDSGGKGQLTILSCICSVAFMSPFLVIEINTIYSYGKSWFRQFWNVIDTAMYTLQVAILVLYLERSHVGTSGYSVILALQCILLFAKIQYFSRVFDTSRGSLVDTLKVVIGDVKWFLLFIFLTMFSFGIAFSILYRDETIMVDGEEDKTFGNVYKSVVSMFAFMLGGFHFEVFYESRNKEAAIVFFLIYESVMAIMLLNLLIAIMTDAYGKVMADERLWNLCSKAQIIDELETTLPRLLTSHWDKPYIHVLKPAPRKDVSMNALWTKLDLAGEQSIKTTTELMGRVEEFRSLVVEKLHEVRRKLDGKTAPLPAR